MKNIQERKAEYSNFCETNPNIPIFLQDWWLDIVSNGRWDVSIVQKGDRIVGVMPFEINKNFGMTFIKNPILSPYLGPWIIFNQNQNQMKRTVYQNKIMTELIQNLPKFTKLSSSFHYSVKNWLPFYWQNFNQTTKYTYILKSGNDLETIFKGFQDKTRWAINKAQKELIIEELYDLQSFYELVIKTYQRQNKKPPYNFTLIENLYKVLSKKNLCKIVVAKDIQNNAHTIGFFVWDNDTVYYLLSGSDPEFRNSGSGSLVIFEGIKFAVESDKDFNFEGSMKKSIEKNFRSFAGIQTPYFRIMKFNSRLIKLKRAIF